MKKINHSNIGRFLMDELLSIKNLTLDEVLLDDKWYINHTWTTVEQDAFKKKYKPYIKKVYGSEHRADVAIELFILQYGYRVID